MADPVRALVVWCPDWPVTAAVREADPGLVRLEHGREAAVSRSVDGRVPGRTVDSAHRSEVAVRGQAGGDRRVLEQPIGSGMSVGALVEHVPIAVFAAGRVYACSELARAEGVRRGQRRRDAQARCPELVVVPHDTARDVRAFEPVVDAVAALAPGVEVLAPGTCAVAARGPASYFGGEEAAAERIVDQIAESCDVEAQVGVADGIFAARLAARAGVLVGPGRTARFLAGLDIRVLGRPELVGLLRRLGIRTLGAFAALPAGDVLSRFGFDAALAHQLAGGGEERLLAPRTPPPDLVVEEEFDPPVERVDTAAFTARSMADHLHERLLQHGVACTRLVIEAVTGQAEELSRTWRHDGTLTAADVADRVRWQLEGWLTQPDRPTAGIVRLRLAPDGIVEHSGFQLGLWGGTGEGRHRAHRALTHVQGLLGPHAVVTPALGGGRSPADRVRLVPWGDERTPARSVEPPWPGRLPAPAPAVLPVEPVPARVRAADGSPVGVTGRHAVTAHPATVAIGGAPPVEISGWAGPWPAEERWWVPGGARRLARLQVALADGRALLLAVEHGQWRVEAEYD
jgi:protein ImuB